MMRVLTIFILSLFCFSSFAGNKACKAELVFAHGTNSEEGEEVISSFDGPIESLTVDYINAKFNKALAKHDVEIAEQGERADFRIIVGHSGLLNDRSNGSMITSAYIYTKGYEKRVDARMTSTLLGVVFRDREKRAKKLFDKVLENFSKKMKTCSI